MNIKLLALDIDGVLTDGAVLLTPTEGDWRRICLVDLDAITSARKAGLKIALVTGEDGTGIDRVVDRVRPDHVVRGAKDKVAGLRQVSEALAVPFEDICYVGDADRDAPALAAAGVGLAPANSTTEARRAARHVLAARGGEGAVNEAWEWLRARREPVAAPPPGDAELARSLTAIIEDSLAAKQRLLGSVEVLAGITRALTGVLQAGRQVLLCGNGGSAADAQHVAAELVGRFYRERKPLPAIALTTDTSALTAIGNDWSFDQVFARQVRALARRGDAVVGISTSGRSPNVLAALKDARAAGAITIGFTGADPGPMADLCNHTFAAPATKTPRIQELHIVAWHGICELVEAAFVQTS